MIMFETKENHLLSSFRISMSIFSATTTSADAIAFLIGQLNY